MAHEIRKVAVLGAGVMGTGIAAHLANAGIPSILFDMVPKDAGDSPKARNALAIKGIEGALKLKPAPLFTADRAKLITPANYDDHGALLAECDWIVEVVVERLDIKKKVFEWVAANRHNHAILSSNTSGIPLADMAAGMSKELREHFLITHFFNPVRYMRLLELVQGEDTLPEVVSRLADFGESKLGKGIVYAKDTPNFIGNRIGVFGIAATFKHMVAEGFTVEQVDAIFGSNMGRASSAVFRTADVVGLDTLGHVFDNLYEAVPNDEQRGAFKLPGFVRKLIDAGALGQKSGAGFYKKATVNGKKEILVLDLATGDYRAQEKPRFDAIGKAKKQETPGGKVKAMVDSDDAAGKLAWKVTADTLIYAATRIPEIADDVVNVDNAMKWGFGWELGPFESWDAIGVQAAVTRMEADGLTVPAWVKSMLAAGRTSFYERDAKGTMTFWQRDGGAAPVLGTKRAILLADLKAKSSPVARNPSASLHDLGDGVLGLEFTSKMNSLDNLTFDMYSLALDKLDAGDFDALVVGNQDPRAFCAGANVLMILMGAMQGEFGQIEAQINQLQQLMMRAKYSRKPVVTAPHGLTLGGGAEVTMHSAATVAAGELYMGLVEVGVGLIPGGGGCKELLVRYLGDVPQDIDYDPIPAVQKAFQHIGLGEVATSAGEARAWGFLRPTDRITLNPELVLADAKRLARALADSGYVAPDQRTIKVPGTSAKAAIELYLYQMKIGGYATEHDITVGTRLANVLVGGDVPAGTVRTEQDLLDLEREAFLSLCGEAKSQARMQHMLQSGKPLRN